MLIREVTPNEIENIKPLARKFIKRYGDGRITLRAVRWFNELNAQTATRGTYIAAALDQQKVVGVIVVGDYGLQEAFIAVHSEYRKQKVGEALVKRALYRLGKLYTRVACDNVASLKLCFNCGLVAFHLFTGPTGKPTLWLGGGRFHPREIEKSPLR